MPNPRHARNDGDPPLATVESFAVGLPTSREETTRFWLDLRCCT